MLDFKSIALRTSCDGLASPLSLFIFFRMHVYGLVLLVGVKTALDVSLVVSDGTSVQQPQYLNSG